MTTAMHHAIVALLRPGGRRRHTPNSATRGILWWPLPTPERCWPAIRRFPAVRTTTTGRGTIPSCRTPSLKRWPAAPSPPPCGSSSCPPAIPAQRCFTTRTPCGRRPASRRRAGMQRLERSISGGFRHHQGSAQSQDYLIASSNGTGTPSRTLVPLLLHVSFCTDLHRTFNASARYTANTSQTLLRQRNPLITNAPG